MPGALQWPLLLCPTPAGLHNVPVGFPATRAGAGRVWSSPGWGEDGGETEEVGKELRRGGEEAARVLGFIPGPQGEGRYTLLLSKEPYTWFYPSRANVHLLFYGEPVTCPGVCGWGSVEMSMLSVILNI